MGLTFSARLAIATGIVLGAPVAACSSAKGPGYMAGSVNPTPTATPGDDDSGTTPIPGTTSGSSSGGVAGGFTQTYSDAGNVGPSTVDAACAFSEHMGEQQALDAYMMLDYSASMQMDGKWTGVTAAINSFVGQTTLTGISVGLQYFGLPDPDAGTGGGGLFGGGAFNDSCNPAVYANPEIEISPLPGVASRITSSLASHTKPDTSTPTPAALQGAINHAAAWSKAHPSDATIVILATDGDPTECGKTKNESAAQLLTDTEAVAASGVAETPKILTFVIGVGSDANNLNGIAMSGGTGTAFLVDTSMNVSTQFLAALNKIRGAALGCQYKIPVPMTGTTNYNEVNVQFTASGGKPEIVPQVANKAACPASSNAWYYDNPAMPTEIYLCTTTCGTVATGGTVDVLTGCQTVVVPTK
jgi:hypothetical protein